jgi:hypothetical protein
MIDHVTGYGEYYLQNLTIIIIIFGLTLLYLAYRAYCWWQTEGSGPADPWDRGNKGGPFDGPY